MERDVFFDVNQDDSSLELREAKGRQVEVVITVEGDIATSITITREEAAALAVALDNWLEGK